MEVKISQKRSMDVRSMWMIGAMEIMRREEQSSSDEVESFREGMVSLRM